MHLVVADFTVENTAPILPFVPRSRKIERNVDDFGQPIGEDVYELFFGVPFD